MCHIGAHIFNRLKPLLGLHFTDFLISGNRLTNRAHRSTACVTGLSPLKDFDMKNLALAAACLCAVSTPAMATVLPLNGGWQADRTNAVGVASPSSPWTFTLTNNAFFRLTDAFITGDVYTATDTGNALTFVSTFTTDGAAVPAYQGTAWSDTRYSRFSKVLGAGSYSFTITGNCAGGCPAGFAVRLDTAPAAVPEPATWAMLVLGFGLIGAAMRRRSVKVTYA
jgi:hypothetical protein